MTRKNSKLAKELVRLVNANPGTDFRIATCKRTKKKVVQVKEPSGDWLCLHR